MDATIGNSAAIGILKINSAGTPTGNIELVGLANVATSAAIGNSSTGLIDLDGTILYDNWNSDIYNRYWR